DIIRAVRAKVAAAGVQPFNRAAVTNDPPIRVERQHPVGAAVEKEQTFVPIDGKAAWIGNAAVTAEGTERPAKARLASRRLPESPLIPPQSTRCLELCHRKSSAPNREKWSP